MARERVQLQIDGTQDIGEIDEITDASEDYRVVRDERMALTKKETETKAKLLDAMLRHNRDSYRYEDGKGKMRLVTVDREPTVKVKGIKVEDAAEGEVDDETPNDDSNVNVQ